MCMQLQWHAHVKRTRTRNTFTRTEVHMSRSKDLSKIKKEMIKWKCIPGERNIVLSKGHVLYVCVVHRLNKTYI